MILPYCSSTGLSPGDRAGTRYHMGDELEMRRCHPWKPSPRKTFLIQTTRGQGDVSLASLLSRGCVVVPGAPAAAGQGMGKLDMLASPTLRFSLVRVHQGPRRAKPYNT